VSAQATPGVEREAILAEAVRWIGTPYRHQASKRGVGADCLGLVIGVWNGLAETPLILPRHDHRNWAQHAKGEPLLEGLRRFLREKPPTQARARRCAGTALAAGLARLASGDLDARCHHHPRL
jgi:NlpC/P60 family putative phage cell wall peptidase